MSKGVKKIVQGKVPNLSKFEDVSEFLTKSGNLSESEFEDDETSRVTLPQEMGSRGNQAAQQSSIRYYQAELTCFLSCLKMLTILYFFQIS